MISEVLRPVFTKSSVFSLLSTATAIAVNNSRQKKKVIRNFFSMYQSSVRILPKVAEIIIGVDMNQCGLSAMSFFTFIFGFFLMVLIQFKGIFA